MMHHANCLDVPSKFTMVETNEGLRGYDPPSSFFSNFKRERMEERGDLLYVKQALISSEKAKPSLVWPVVPREAHQRYP